VEGKLEREGLSTGSLPLPYFHLKMSHFSAMSCFAITFWVGHFLISIQVKEQGWLHFPCAFPAQFFSRVLNLVLSPIAFAYLCAFCFLHLTRQKLQRCQSQVLHSLLYPHSPELCPTYIISEYLMKRWIVLLEISNLGDAREWCKSLHPDSA
jgi:hypothetical protein